MAFLASQAHNFRNYTSGVPAKVQVTVEVKLPVSMTAPGNSNVTLSVFQLKSEVKRASGSAFKISEVTVLPSASILKSFNADTLPLGSDV